MKKEGKDLEGGRCLRGRDGQLGFIVEDGSKIWKEPMGKTMNEANEWGQMVETDVVERPMKRVTGEEIVNAVQKMKSRKPTSDYTIGSKCGGDSGKWRNWVETDGGPVSVCIAWWRNA